MQQRQAEAGAPCRCSVQGTGRGRGGLAAAGAGARAGAAVCSGCVRRRAGGGPGVLVAALRPGALPAAQHEPVRHTAGVGGGGDRCGWGGRGLLGGQGPAGVTHARLPAPDCSAACTRAHLGAARFRPPSLLRARMYLLALLSPRASTVSAPARRSTAPSRCWSWPAARWCWPAAPLCLGSTACWRWGASLRPRSSCSPARGLPACCSCRRARPARTSASWTPGSQACGAAAAGPAAAAAAAALTPSSPCWPPATALAPWRSRGRAGVLRSRRGVLLSRAQHQPPETQASRGQRETLRRSQRWAAPAASCWRLTARGTAGSGKTEKRRRRS